MCHVYVQTAVEDKESPAMIAVLGCAFVTMLILKLANVVAWSWILITSPLWIIPAGYGIGVASLFSLEKWDRYMGFIPDLPTFWFDHPKHASVKIALFTVGLILIFAYYPS